MEPLITTLYWIAGVSTGLFALRLVLMLFGFDHNAGSAFDALHAADAGHVADALHTHDAQGSAQFRMLSLQSIVVTLMVGGWVSLLCIQGWKMDPVPGLGAGVGVGFATGVAVAYALFSMRKLEADGTLRDFKAEGLHGTCYVQIPEAGKGAGQVQITIGNRERIFDAVSDGPAIASFKAIVVMAKIDEKTLRVCETQ